MVNKVRRLFGKSFGGKGYISKALIECLQLEQVQVVTDIKKNMKNELVNLYDKLMLRERAIIETEFGICKEVVCSVLQRFSLERLRTFPRPPIMTATAKRMRRFFETAFGICGKAQTDFLPCSSELQPINQLRRLICPD